MRWRCGSGRARPATTGVDENAPPWFPDPIMNYQGPGYYAPPTQPAKTTVTDVVVPLALSVFCGFGGFVWGLVRLAQGHNRPGWVAIAVNAGVWAVGIGLWIVFAVILGVAAHNVPVPVHS